jgi:Fur family ferric uptake transcriptional regulator
MAKPLNDDSIQTAENIFREYLRDRGLKYTPERRAVLREVLRNDDHFEAEQLLIALRQSGERVAKATVYRTLPLLVNCGIIKQIQFGDKLARYEHTFGQDAHDHMVCQRCRRIIEFDSSDVDRLRTVVASQHRFYATAHRFQITGLCWECIQACPPGERPFLPSGE